MAEPPHETPRDEPEHVRAVLRSTAAPPPDSGPEPGSQGRLPRPGELVEGVPTPGDGHEQWLRGPCDDRPAPGTPVEVGRDQAQSTGSPECPDRWCGAAEGQRLGEPIGW